MGGGQSRSGARKPPISSCIVVGCLEALPKDIDKLEFPVPENMTFYEEKGVCRYNSVKALKMRLLWVN